MSLAHVRLVKIAESARSVLYEAQSPDFSANSDWETIARIELLKDSGDFTFTAQNHWVDKKVVPPSVYALPPSEMEAAMRGPYLGYGFGAWTGRMMSRIREVMSSGTYPDCL
jgi:hypothetical protein